MAQTSSPVRPFVIGIVALFVIIIALPAEWKQWLPGFLSRPDFHFGLDLAGGTQLDFRISEAEIDKQLAGIDAQLASGQITGEQSNLLLLERQVVELQRQNLVEAIRTVLERRINSLGVSEATITPSYIGGEKHLLIECPGVVDVQQCIATVGKTIQLEFKEEFTEATKEYEQEVKNKAAATLRRMRGSGTSLEVVGQDLGNQLGMGYIPSQTYFRDQLPKGLEGLWTGTPANGVQLLNGSITQPVQDAQGAMTDEIIPGVFLAQVLAPRTMTGRLIQDAPTAFTTLQKTEKGTAYETKNDVPLDSLSVPVIAGLRSMKAGDLKVATMTDGSAKLLFLRLFTPGREEVSASHILVTYKGASGAEPTVTRTKEQALARAQELQKQLSAGANFAALARSASDGPSAQNGGSLGFFPRGSLVPAFEDIAFTAPVGKVSDPVETPFGYHLIRTDQSPKMTQDRAAFDALTVTGTDAVSRANEFLARLQSGRLTSNEEAVRIGFLFFSLRPSGWKDTALDGKHFRTASVTMDPTLNLPVVQIVFDTEGAKLFAELTKNNVGKRIAIFVGGELVSAPTVQQAIIGGTAVITGSASIEEAQKLAQDLNTGAIPAPIYLSGQRTVEATLGAQALWTSLVAAIVGALSLMIYPILVYRLRGRIANARLLIVPVLFMVILKLPLFVFSSQYIVLTLAGAAGLILSLGMAVDTNVLVFERVKEELKKGKMLRTAIDTGFTKAWPSVRDSNISTLITCAILFLIGTSIVRGFAITLGMGVFISMLTGMVISRSIAHFIIATFPQLENTPWLFPGKERQDSAGPSQQ